MKVYAVSDIHTDYPENMAWIKSLSKSEYGDDALIVAGDVSDDEATLIETFCHLVSVFRHVFFVVGNHDVWLRKSSAVEDRKDETEVAPSASATTSPGDGGGNPPSSSSTAAAAVPPRLRKFRDSIEKIMALRADLAALGVRTTPTLLDGARVLFPPPENDDGEKKKIKHRRNRTSTPLWIVPILSWYSSSFDTEPGIPGLDVDPSKIYTDFRACKWPPSLDPKEQHDGGEALARFFDSLNDPQLTSLTDNLNKHENNDDDADNKKNKSTSSSPPPPPRPVVITFSHFLPFLELLPEKRFVTAPSLAKVAGSQLLGRRVAALSADVHVFGHTHIPYDGVLHPADSSIAPSIDAAAAAVETEAAAEKTTAATPLPLPLKTRFVQAPLRYPAERRRSREGRGETNEQERPYELQLIWDCGGENEGDEEEGEEEETSGTSSEDGNEGSELPRRRSTVVFRRGVPGATREAFWTKYYETTPRDPNNLELAPWVKPRVEKYRNQNL